MTGQLVNNGTPPLHKCNTDFAPGRPNIYSINEGAVWRCECGKFWKKKIVLVQDLWDDNDCYEPHWIQVKNANGDEWIVEIIPPNEYLTQDLFRATCTEHGRVSKKHRHHRWV